MVSFDDLVPLPERNPRRVPGPDRNPRRQTGLAPLTGERVGATDAGRPLVATQDGGVSSERTRTEYVDGAWRNFPTMFGGREVDVDEAVDIMRANGWRDPETGRDFSTTYRDVDEAVSAAQKRSADLGAERESPGLTFDDLVPTSTPGKSAGPDFADLVPEEEPGVLDRLGRGLRHGLGLTAQGVDVTTQVLTGDDADLAETIARQNQAQPDTSPDLTAIQQRIQKAAEPSQGAWGRGEYLTSLKGTFDTIVAAGGEFVNDPVSFAEFSAQALGTSALPIAGMVVGGIAGSPVPVVGSTGGAIAGGFAGSAALEFGLWVQEKVSEKVIEQGGDARKTEDVAAVLADPATRAEIMEEAATKGLTHAAVGALLDRVSAGLLRYAPATRLGRGAKTLGAGAAQTVSEGLEEATSQVAATGDFDVADVALETVASPGAAVAQTGVLAAAERTARVADHLNRAGTPKGAVPADQVISDPDAEVPEQDDFESLIPREALDPAPQLSDDLRKAAKSRLERYLTLEGEAQSAPRQQWREGLAEELRAAEDALIEVFKVTGLPGDRADNQQPIRNAADMRQAFRAASPREVQRFLGAIGYGTQDTILPQSEAAGVSAPGPREETGDLIGDPVAAMPPHRVAAADNTAIEVAPVVVESDALVTSSDPGYEASLQPRDRDRVASEAQVHTIAARLDPERLGTSSEADRGAPIVGGDGLVESGNGRIMALRRAYAQNSAAAERYRDWLSSQGVDVEKYRNPVLVRQRLTALEGEARQRFTVAANQAATMSLGASERALADARRLTPETLEQIAVPGDLAAAGNRTFVRSFLTTLPESEQAAMVTGEGQLSSDGLTRIRNAVLARAYGNPDILSRLSEATNDEIRAISNALVTVAPQWARLRADIESGQVSRDVDLTDELVEAVRRTADFRAMGKGLQSYLDQQDAFDRIDGAVESFMRIFYDPQGRRAAGATRIADGLAFYVEEARKVSAETGLDLGVEPVRAADIQNLMLRRARDGDTQSLQLESRPGDGPGAAAPRAEASRQETQETGRDTGDQGERSPAEGREEPAAGELRPRTPTVGEGTPQSPVEAQSAEDVERAAERAEEPKSDAQAEAGNYKKGHIRFHGLDITIEVPKGGTRRKLDEDGNTVWSVPNMPAHYGYLKRSEGADGENVDVYVGEYLEADTVYIVDQQNPDTGAFDEHKVLLAFPDRTSALNGYTLSFSDGKGQARVGAVAEMSVDAFREWLKRPAPRPAARDDDVNQRRAAHEEWKKGRDHAEASLVVDARIDPDRKGWQGAPTAEIKVGKWTDGSFALTYSWNLPPGDGVGRPWVPGYATAADAQVVAVDEMRTRFGAALADDGTSSSAQKEARRALDWLDREFGSAATASVAAGDSDETVTITLIRDGPWDFNDTYPAPDPDVQKALIREGRWQFENTEGPGLAEEVAYTFDESLNELQSYLATEYALRDQIKAAKADPKLKPPKRGMSRETWLKQLEQERKTQRRNGLDLIGTYTDIFGAKASRALYDEARSRVAAERRTSPQSAEQVRAQAELALEGADEDARPDRTALGAPRPRPPRNAGREETEPAPASPREAQPSLFAPDQESESEAEDPVAAKLIDAGLMTAYQTTLENKKEKSKSRLFRFPATYIGPDDPRGPAIILHHPDLADLPYIKELEKVSKLKARPAPANWQPAEQAQYHHAVDLATDADWQELVATADLIDEDKIFAGASLGVQYYRLSPENARALLAQTGSQEPTRAEILGDLARTRINKVDKGKEAVAMHQSGVPSVWLEIVAQEEGYVKKDRSGFEAPTQKLRDLIEAGPEEAERQAIAELEQFSGSDEDIRAAIDGHTEMQAGAADELRRRVRPDMTVKQVNDLLNDAWGPAKGGNSRVPGVLDTESRNANLRIRVRQDGEAKTIVLRGKKLADHIKALYASETESEESAEEPASGLTAKDYGEGKQPDEPDWDFVPHDGWRTNLVKARVYANALKIDHRSMLLDDVVKAIDEKLAEQRGDVKSDGSPQIALAHALRARLEQGEKITSKAISEEAKKAYGAGYAEGKLDRKTAFDALELAVNLMIRDDATLRVDGTLGAKAADALDGVMRLLPTQTVRSDEQIRMQQFSTPPHYASAAAYAAGLTGNDVVLESSAGTGSLIAAAAQDGVTFIANELSETRIPLLREIVGDRGQVFTEDAEQIHNILPDDLRPTVALMNPPFSRAGKRTGDKVQPMAAAKHIEAALKTLAPGGRLVAIVGHGMALDAPKFRAWWSKLSKSNAIRANIAVAKPVFGKYGTTFGTRLVVIDKTEPKGEPVTAKAETPAELMALLEPIRNDRETIRETGEQPPAEPGRAETPQRSGSGRAGASSPSPEPGLLGAGDGGRRGLAAERDTGAGDAGRGTAGLEAEERDGVAGGEPERTAEAGPGPRTPSGDRDGVEPENRGRDGAERDLGETAGAEPGVERVTLEPSPVAQQPRALGESLYETYEPSRASVKGAKPHPGPLVEAASMASVAAPEATYSPELPKSVISDGLLSGAQLETVVYAGQAHAEMLPAAEGDTAYRRGYFIGDGTGVGKGREVAGIILDNWGQGRTKAIWVSEKKTLMQDAKRDWGGLKQNKKLIFDLGSVRTGETVTAKQGIAFVTYDTLKGGMSDQQAIAQGNLVRRQKVSVNGQSGAVQKITKGKSPQVTVKLDNGDTITVDRSEVTALEEMAVKSRVDQLVEWFGEDFDGVIAFDEAHNMGNATSVKGSRGLKTAAQKALAGLELQKRLPNARVVYVSATGATEVSNLAYADRLGLWGRETPFASREEFVTQVDAGGIAAMELIARDMKQLGLYTARNLSFDGVEYERLEHELDANQREIYDTLAEAWQSVLSNIGEALEETNANLDSRARAAAASAFWGAHQRFFNQIVTAMQMPSVIADIENELKAGRQVVLQLTNTNEASQERAAAKAKTADDIEDLDITPRDQVIQLVEASFPTQQYETYVDDNGNERSRPVVDSQGNPVTNREAEAMKERLIDRLASIRVPQGPLDMILDHFGVDEVAEVTGRKRRFVMKPDPKTGEMRRVEDKRGSKANIAETDAFQAGKKRILIFSEAGGTGRSYHADNKSKSKNARRVHYLLQGGWRADKAVQGFGRSHRTDQASAPVFKLVTTDLKGQKRFISSIARRLAQLGALTKGQRQAGDQGLFSAADNLESTEARIALHQFYIDLVAGAVDGITLNEFETQTGLKIANTDEEGRSGGAKQTFPPITQFLNRLLSLKVDLQNDVFDAFSERLETVVAARREAGLLDVGLETIQGDKITTDSEQTVHTDERTGAETRYVKFTVARKFEPLSFEEIEARNPERWVLSPKGKVYAVRKTANLTDATGRVLAQYKIHHPVTGSRIVAKVNVDAWETIGTEDARKRWTEAIERAPEFIEKPLHLISGAILPIWDRLEGSPRVVRLQSDDGNRFIGRVVTQRELAPTLAALGADATADAIDPKQLFDQLMQGGSVRLANGWRLKRARVADEWRIELVGPSSFSEGEAVEKDGVFSERISYRKRYFVPTDESGVKTLQTLTKNRPVVDAVESGDFDEDDVALFSLGPQKPLAPVYYSAVLRAVENAKTARAAAQQWLATLRKTPGVRQEELEWTGVEDWLSEQDGPVTREALSEYLAANELRVEDVIKAATVQMSDVLAAEDWLLENGEEEAAELVGDAADGENDALAVIERVLPDKLMDPFRVHFGEGGTRYNKHVLPGGLNYRELLLTLPVATDPDSAVDLADRGLLDETYSGIDENRTFRGSHFDEPNVVAHVRFNERYGPDGERILFLEEIQSDWHQEGRKKGYRGKKLDLKDLPDGYDVVTIGPRAQDYVVRGPGSEIITAPYPTREGAFRAGLETINELGGTGTTPNAPFKTTWPELALKRMVRWAAENGFDHVAWTTGEQQAERYDLSKQIETIGYENRGENVNITIWDKSEKVIFNDQSLTPDRLQALVGKELAEKIAKGEGRKDQGFIYLEDQDLSVGGEGMKTFYDKIVVNAANKIGKKYGARTQPMDLGPTGTVHALPLTPELKETALGGLPLFKRASNTTAVPRELIRRVHGVEAIFPDLDHVKLYELGQRLKVNDPGIDIAETRALFDRFKGFAIEDPESGVTFQNLRDLGDLALEYYAGVSEEAVKGNRFEVWDMVDPDQRETWLRREIAERRQAERENRAARGLADIGFQPVFTQKFAAQHRAVYPVLRRELDRLGLESVGLRLAHDFEAWVDGRASSVHGIYHRNMLYVALDRTPSVIAHTLNHEALHAMRRLKLFSDAEWEVLTRESNATWRARFDIDSRYENWPEWIKVEEGIADAYAAWTQGAFRPDTTIERLFQRIREFLQALRNALAGAGFRTASDIFADIQSGAIGARAERPAQGPVLFHVKSGDGDLFKTEVVQTEDGPVEQYVIPGAERMSDAERAQAEADKALKPKVAQKGLEGLDLFDDEQGTLFSVAPPTRSDAFKRWFGDSKVVDEAGEPLVVYHGTSARFEQFSTDSGLVWFTDDRDAAATYSYPGSRQVEAYLSIKNPARDSDVVAAARVAGVDRETIEDEYSAKLLEIGGVAEVLGQRGFDGAIVSDTSSEGANDITSYVAFRPEQIKSVSNRGTFDPDDPDIRFSLARDPRTQAERRNAMQGFIARGQPLDRALRVPFDWFGGTTADGRWKPGIALFEGASDILTSATFSDTGKFAFLNPMLETARRGLVDRYGLDPDYVDRERRRSLDERAVMLEGAEILKSLKDHAVGPEEAKVLQAILTGERVADQDMARLAEPIRAAIDQLGQEAVNLGLVSPESFARNRGTYLHRVYKKYEAEEAGLQRAVSQIMTWRRKKIIGDQFRGRGMFKDVKLARLMRDVPGWVEGGKNPDKGDKFLILDEVPDQIGTEDAPEPKAVRRIYWPENVPVPDRYASFRNEGVWEIRDVKRGEYVLWRDFTKAERETMGEILDARYTIGKTFMLMAHDLSVGKFYKDIAENEAWTLNQTPNAKWLDADEWQRQKLRNRSADDIEWVRVPTTEIPNSGKKRWGALAGRYVREEIWRDLNELELARLPGTWQTLLTQWKLNKTARSPVVHMNNVMSNVVLMDLADVRMQDLIAGIRSYASGDENYEEAFHNGAFGADMMSQEIRDNVLKPVLQEIMKEDTFTQGKLGMMGQVSRLTEALWSRLKGLDQMMIDGYRLEDEIFRMAMYMRRRSLGDTAKQAADAAREQFIDYDIRAPWVNMARRSVLPFISYTYRAAPLVARSVATRPWKLAKYALLAYVLNALAYSMTGGDEEEERGSLREAEQGSTWFGGYRMLRMPFNDTYGNPVFLDVRRWAPAGDVFDLQGSDLPSWLHLGSPLMIGMELYLNKSAFTGEEIYNEETDSFWDRMTKRGDFVYKAWMPSAAWVPNSWYWEKIGRAARGATDRMGRPYDIGMALASSVGIKLKPQDVADGYAWKAYELTRAERALMRETRRLTNQRERNMISEEVYNRQVQNILEKLEGLAEKADELGRSGH